MSRFYGGKMKKYIIITLLLILLSVGVASAGIVVNVQPGSLDAIRGETVVYEIKTDSISDIDEHVVLSIRDPVPGWGYVFDTRAFDLAPGASLITNLHVQVPATESPGTYSSDVLGTASAPGFDDFVTGDSFFTFITNVSIPEFASIAMPVISVIGLVFIFGRNKRKNN